MRAQLGYAMLAIGTAAAVLGVATLGAGIHLHRPALLRLARRYVIVVLAAAVGAFVVMESAMFAHDFSFAYVADNVARATPGLYTFTAAWSALEGSILLWALALSAYVGFTTWRFRARAEDPLVAWATLVQLVVLALLLRVDALPGEPVPGGARRDPDRRAGPEPAAAEQPARRDPPADPLRGLRRVHDPVLVRDRRARDRPLRRRAGSPTCGARRSSRSGSSPSASSSARSGATRCSAGAATGVGIRWRTRRCCRGSPRSRSSIR